MSKGPQFPKWQQLRMVWILRRDLVLGSKPNITPKDVKCGLAEDANTTTVGDSDTLPEWNIPADYKRNADLEQELKRKLKNNLKGTQNVPKKGAKEKCLL